MFLVLFEATARRNSGSEPDVGGAYVNCWIDRPTLEEAVLAARTGVEKNGWIVGEPDEAYAVDAATYPPGKDGREYYEQAIIDKEVFVFYTYPEIDEKPDGA